MKQTLTAAERRDRIGIGVVISLIIIVLLLLYLWNAIFVVIPSGHVGVLYSTFLGGTVTEHVYLEGLQVKWPWNAMTVYDARVQTRRVTIAALTTDSLPVEVSLTAFFRIRRQSVPFLHRDIGPDYREKLITPVLVSSTRESFGRLTAEDLHRNATLVVQEAILAECRREANSRHTTYDDLMIENLRLPPVVAAAIEEKMVAEERAEAYTHLIRAAHGEAERKRIEALGIQRHNDIVRGSLSPALLTWQGIRATVDLAQSNNAKVVVIGNGGNQLPLILGGEIGSLPAGAAGAPPPAAALQALPPFVPEPRKEPTLVPQPVLSPQPAPFRAVPPLAPDTMPESPPERPSLWDRIVRFFGGGS
ncbi:MAG TPA: prohibitin family protein [Thermoanaerobaculia bacterium]|nr:prohibitin family protein [Thermoanaerobaculia bacterium]